MLCLWVDFRDKCKSTFNHVVNFYSFRPGDNYRGAKRDDSELSDINYLHSTSRIHESNRYIHLYITGKPKLK